MKCYQPLNLHTLHLSKKKTTVRIFGTRDYKYFSIFDINHVFVFIYADEYLLKKLNTLLNILYL